MALFNKLTEQALALGALKSVKDTISGITSDIGRSQTTPKQTPQQTTSSKSQMYDETMEKLIDMAIANGELSEKGKQVLFKRAQSQGIDLDELELVLETRLNEKRNAMNAAQSPAQKSNKYGEVRKCPTCGAFVEPFTTRCPECGFEFTEVGCVSSFEELSRRLSEIDSSRLANILENTWDGGESRIQKKKQIIATFPIPTAKEDLLEFLSMALPLAKKQKQKVGLFPTVRALSAARVDPEQNALADAWRSKVEQVITKARFALKNDPVTLQEIEQYAQELNKKK